MRRRRFVRGIVALVLGMAWSSCAMILAMQLGWVSYFEQTPIVLGVIFGASATVLWTITQMAAKKLRILYVFNRLSVLLLLVVASTGTLIADAPPAEAQTGAPCDVSVIGAGLYRDGAPLSAALDMATTTEANPLVVRPSELVDVDVIWNVDSDQSLEGKKWSVETEVAGVPYELLTAEGEHDRDTYVVREFPDDVVPGHYKVWGRFDGICRTQFGYIQVVGSPFTNLIGQLALAGLIIGLLAAITHARRSRLDVWSMTTSDGVTVEILNPDTGKLVRGPLAAGATYGASVSIDFPDAPSAYDGVPPIDVLIGVLGAVAEPRLRSIHAGKGATPSTMAPFTVPSAGEALELVVDLASDGDPLDSIRISAEPTSTGELKVQSAMGSLTYRSGNFGAAHLASVGRADSTLSLHGNAAGTELEVWTTAGEQFLRVASRNRVTVKEMAKAADSYRADLRSAIRTWALIEDDSGQEQALATLRALAFSGSRLRRLLLGDGDSASPVDGVVVVVPDLKTTGAMTFPWAGLYEGDVGTSAVATLCEHYASAPERCNSHEPGTICPNLFWGFRHELAWPNGWIRRTARGAPSSIGERARDLFSSSKTAEILPNRLRNSLPVKIVSVVPDIMTEYDRLPTTARAFNANLMQATTADTLAALHQTTGSEADLVYVFAHGKQAPPEPPDAAANGETPITRGGFTVELDQGLDGFAFDQLLGDRPFSNGPLVFVNACRSGIVGLKGQHGLIDALVLNGARGVIVTESEVLADEAADAASAIVSRVLEGTRVSRAIVEARRQDLAENRRLSMLTYSYYGPGGLHFTRPSTQPVINVDESPAAFTSAVRTF